MVLAKKINHSGIERSQQLSHLRPDVFSVKDPQGALLRNGRPGGTRRLKTSAETIQKVADRIGESSQGTDEDRCVLTQTTICTTEEKAENDAFDDTALEEDEAFYSHDEGDASFEALWTDELSFL
ncbi:hypothetical protein V1527DRAFT_509661 [Lipomyces starkeyi]